MLGYGFVIGAFLVINTGDRMLVPFASMDACETAREMVVQALPFPKSSGPYYVCVPTGATLDLRGG